MTSSVLLNTFLAEQDKRIDFGLSALYKKVHDGDDLNFENEIMMASNIDEKMLTME